MARKQGIHTRHAVARKQGVRTRPAVARKQHVGESGHRAPVVALGCPERHGIYLFLNRPLCDISFPAMMTVEDPVGDHYHWIMIVDDEMDALSSVWNAVSEWAAANSLGVLTAGSCDYAMELLLEHEPHVWLLVSDLQVSGANGAGFLEQVSARFPHVVSLALTEENDPVQINRIVRAGVFAYLSKDWDPDELLTELSRAYEFGRSERKQSRYLKRLESELKWGGELQQKLLDVELPARADCSVLVTYRPLPWLSCGGDYYDVVPYHDDSLIVLIGDVSGHGVQGAFVTTLLKSLIYRGYIRESLKTGFSPADFLVWLNEQLLKELVSVPDVIVTFSATLLNLPEKRMVTASAGHEPVYVANATRCSPVVSSGPALGISGDARFTEREYTFESGDILTFMTDGVIEHPGMHRRLSLTDVADILVHFPSAETPPGDILHEFAGRLDIPEQQDDITLIRLGIV